MIKTVYLMRHGETLFNRQHKSQGWCDSPLTENGIRRAKETGDLLREKGISVDAYYCSTAERACDTLELAFPGVPYERRKGLREIGFGEFEAKDQCLELHPFGDFYVPYGGESEDGATDRLENDLKELLAQEKNNSILCVTHGGVTTMFYRKHKEPDQPFAHLDNCGVFRWKYDTETQRFFDGTVLLPGFVDKWISPDMAAAGVKY